MIFKVYINSGNLTLHMHVLIYDRMYSILLCKKGHQCTRVTNDEVCTGISISSVCEPVTLNHQISHNHGKSMILKVDACSFSLRLVQLFRNRLPYHFYLTVLVRLFILNPIASASKN
ncbi:hypothetical protein TSAR_002706, partial [Trichomalopsis sarcophagae]